MSGSDSHSSKLHGDAIRPLKWGRVTLHIGGGLLVLLCYLAYFSHPQITILSACMLAALASLDFLRARFDSFNQFIFTHFGNFTQPHERLHVTSATWFWLAMFLVALLDHPITYIVTLAILTLADQAGSIVGRRFGTIPLGSGRSLQGFLAFVGVGFVSAILALICSSLVLSSSELLLLGGAGSLAGGIAELGSERIDDNLSVGIAVGATVFGLSTFLQVG